MKPQIFTHASENTGNSANRYRLFVVTTFLLLLSTSLWAQDVLMGLTSNGGPEGKGTAFSFKTDTKAFTVIKGFADWGNNPVSDLVRASDGQLYGMTPRGGTFDYGTLFRISPSGDMTILKHFNGQSDGGYPNGSLIQAKDGWLYGMTTTASSGYYGTIFKISPFTGQFIVVKMLAVNTDGGRPNGHLVQANDGNFYGITRSGGSTGYGTIFKLTTGGSYSVLKTLNGPTDGWECYGSLMQASDGDFYGMTRRGGTYDYGVIFRYSLTTGYKVLKNLNRAVDAAYPNGDLVEKGDYLYGMSTSGIAFNGVAFKLKKDGTGFSVIHQFNVSAEGGNPSGSFMVGSDGYLYGMVYSVSGYAGGIFKMSTSGSTSSVKKFTSATEGEGPLGSLIQLPDGTLCGMTQYGGKYGKGTIFKRTAAGTFTVLAHMNGAAAGNQPQNKLALGKDSAYYGVTYSGGAYNWGTIFKVCGGITTVLKSFNRNVDGSNPSGGLVRGKDGNLYGTTESGGTNGGGTIFRIKPDGTSFVVLRHLTSTTDGSTPKGTLALASGTDSSLYGTTYAGGKNGGGTIFKITQKGAFTVLHHFAYATEGDHVETGLVFKDSVFYGMTSNATRFYKINPSGIFKVIKTLTYGTDGSYSLGNMIVGTDGYLYGTMSLGGTYGKGVVYKIKTDGTMTKLRQINGTTDGSYPKGGLAQSSDGYFYGTTAAGGTNGVGTIFKVKGDATGFAVIRNFDLVKDGGTPLSGLIVAPKITLTATAQSGSTTEDVAKAITLAGTGSSSLTFNILIKPKNGTVTSGTAAARTYTPNPNFNGVDSFAFTSNLGCLSSAPAWVKITVSSVNDAPVLATIGNKSVVKGTQLKFIATATDVDPGQTKTFSLIGAPSGATISSTTGTFTWTPSVTGSFTFKVRVTDNGSPVLYDEETITVTVTAPALVNASVTTMAASIPDNVTETPHTVAATVYPNPASDKLTLTWTGTLQNAAVRIIDMRGVVLYQQQHVNTESSTLEINVRSLRPGEYLLQLQTTQGNKAILFTKL